MPNIIDSLIVELKLEAKDLNAKADVVQKKLEGIEKTASSTEEGFSNLSGAVKTFGAVLGGLIGAAAVTTLAKDLIATNTQLYYMSQNLGINAQRLYAWGQMARQVGGSAGDMQSLFERIRQIPAELRFGHVPQLLQTLAMFGVDQRLSPENQVEQIAEKFQRYDNSPDRYQGFNFLVAGGLTPGQANVILKGPAWLKSHLKELSGEAPTDEQLKSSAALTSKKVTLEAAVTKLSNDLLQTVTPTINKLADRVQKILDWMNAHGSVAGTLGKGIMGIFGLTALSTAVTVGRTLLGGLGLALGALDSPLVLVTSAIAALSAAGYELYHHWGDIKSAVVKAKPELEKYAVKNFSNFYQKMEYLIEKGEGFFAKGAPNIPQRAHNPGDISYGAFAKRHGATGFIEAAGGHRIATFASDEFGKAALDDLLHAPGYQKLLHEGLTPEEAQQEFLQRWRTGKVSSVLNGASGATHVASSVSSSQHVSHIHTDNSKITNVGSVTVHNPPGSNFSSPSMLRGMDWSTILTQAAGGLLA